ncbi:hypothetical protein QBC46DRAFT_350998 [Diplogelasinospora grovesii]|uniref:C2H2-type domain-containing protein n=1 Tax=Diplogelasinospora grovesii TaxID=303347 RepID=A0AAN6NEG5_9PEZI|nr:hypothetical protein QBC46DRAFT_350998 [Diplogelasinospora grovesii]
MAASSAVSSSVILKSTPTTFYHKWGVYVPVLEKEGCRPRIYVDFSRLLTLEASLAFAFWTMKWGISHSRERPPGNFNPTKEELETNAALLMASRKDLQCNWGKNHRAAIRQRQAARGEKAIAQKKLSCDVCQHTFIRKEHLTHHLKSPEHAAKVAGDGGLFR